jgi:hypothetical protein
VVFLLNDHDKATYRAGLDGFLRAVELVRTDPDNADKWPQIEDGLATAVQIVAYYCYPGPARLEVPAWVRKWEKVNGGGFYEPEGDAA